MYGKGQVVYGEGKFSGEGQVVYGEGQCFTGRTKWYVCKEGGWFTGRVSGVGDGQVAYGEGQWGSSGSSGLCGGSTVYREGPVDRWGQWFTPHPLVQWFTGTE